MHAQLLPGMSRTGKGHHILAVEVIEQVARAATDKANCTVRYQATVDNRFHHCLSELRGCGCRFDNGWHPGKPGWRQLLQHTPAGEVKGVDMHRNTGFGGQHVACGKTALFGERDQLVFRPQCIVRQLAATETGISEKRANAAFDIDPAVTARCSGLRRYGIEIGFQFH